MHLYRFVDVLLYALSLLLLSTYLQAQEEESYAVLDLEGRGISTIEAASLTDRLRSELVSTGRITVVERGLMEQILTEQDFQLAGCTSDECAVEVGQLLGVTKMLAGSIGRVGSTFSIDIRTIDVETGKIIATVIRNYRGEIDGLLDQMGPLAQEFISQEVPVDVSQEQVQIASQPEPDLQVTTQPELKTVDEMVSKWGIADKGIKVGLNLANVGGKDATEDELGFAPKTRIGFALGGYATFDLGLPVLIRPEVFYSMKGFKVDDEIDILGLKFSLKGFQNINYLDINILAQYPINDQISVIAGPSLSPFMGGKYEMTVEALGEKVTEKGDIESDEINGMDMALIVGGSYGLSLPFGDITVEARYSLGLKKAYKDSDADRVLDIKNNVIQIIVGYSF